MTEMQRRSWNARLADLREQVFTNLGEQRDDEAAKDIAMLLFHLAELQWEGRVDVDELARKAA